MRGSNQCRNLVLTSLAALLAVPGIVQAQALHPGDIVIGADIGASSTNIDWGLLDIDPTTGNRTIISDNTHGTGSALSGVTGITMASDGSLLVTSEPPSGTSPANLYRIDPVTGNRTLLSSISGNSGPASTYVGAIQVGNQILMSGGPIVSVDPATGNRTLVSGTGLGSGPAFNAYGFSVLGTDLYVADFSGSILKIDTLTGNRIVLSSATVGNGPSLSNPVDAEFDHAGNLLVPTEPFTGTILSVNPITGDRTVVTSPTVGTGPNLGPFGAQLGVAQDGTLFINSVAISAPSPVLRVDPVTGNRTIVSDATHGTGPAFIPSYGLLVVPNVPEPSSIVLLGMGAISLALAARRQFPVW